MNFRLIVGFGAALALAGCSDDGTAGGDTEGGTDSSGTTGSDSASASGTSGTTGSSESDSASGTSGTTDPTGTSDTTTGGSTGGGTDGSTGGDTDTDTDGTGGSTGGGVEFPCVDNDNQNDCENDPDECTWNAENSECAPTDVAAACEDLEEQADCEMVMLCAWDAENQECIAANSG